MGSGQEPAARFQAEPAATVMILRACRSGRVAGQHPGAVGRLVWVSVQTTRTQPEKICILLGIRHV